MTQASPNAFPYFEDYVPNSNCMFGIEENYNLDLGEPAINSRFSTLPKQNQTFLSVP